MSLMAVMFDLAALSAPPALQQSPEFARALEAFSTPPRHLPDGTLVLERRFAGLPVRMIARPRAQTPMEMRDLLRDLPGAAPVVLAPDRPMDLYRIGAFPVVSPTSVATLDLTPPLDTLESGLHQKWRNRLRHAETQRLKVTRQNMPLDAGHWLFQEDYLQQKERGYRTWPVPLTLAYAATNPGQAKLFTAFMGRTPVAAALVLRHGAAATYHIGHSRAAGRVFSAHNLLIWAAITWAKSKSLQSFELGSLDTEDSPGLARFKLGTGAVARALGGTWLRWPPIAPLARPLARLDRALMRLA